MDETANEVISGLKIKPLASYLLSKRYFTWDIKNIFKEAYGRNITIVFKNGEAWLLIKPRNLYFKWALFNRYFDIDYDTTEKHQIVGKVWRRRIFLKDIQCTIIQGLENKQ